MTFRRSAIACGTPPCQRSVMYAPNWHLFPPVPGLCRSKTSPRQSLRIDSTDAPGFVLSDSFAFAPLASVAEGENAKVFPCVSSLSCKADAFQKTTPSSQHQESMVCWAWSTSATRLSTQSFYVRVEARTSNAPRSSRTLPDLLAEFVVMKGLAHVLKITTLASPGAKGRKCH